MRNLGQRIGWWRETALKIENAILIFFITMIVVVVFFGVIVRYTPITAQTLWTEELARLFLLWTAFWAAGSIERVGGHFRSDLFENVFKGKPKLLLQFFIKLAVLIGVGILLWSSISFTRVTLGVITDQLQWPRIIAVVPLIAGSLLLFAYCLNGFIRIFRRLFE